MRETRVKIGHNFWRILSVGSRLPFRILVTLELDQIPKLTSTEFGVPDFFDFILLVTINLDRRRWRHRASGNCVGTIGLQEGDVEDRMETTHGGRELKADRARVDYLGDLERTKVFGV